MAARPNRQERSKLIRRTPSHGGPGNHILANGFAQEMLRCNDSTIAGIDFGSIRYTEHSTEVIRV
jgi:hypothetical protein